MKEIIHNSWQTVLSAEFENHIIKNCGNFEKRISDTNDLSRYVSFIFSVRTNPF